MTGFSVDPTDVDELVALVKSAGVRSVSDESAKITPPGVHVQTLGYTFDRAKAGAYTLNARLVLVVPDQTPRRARRALQELLNKVLTKVSPAGPVIARTVLLPDSQQLLPGLAIPVNARITPTEEP